MGLSIEVGSLARGHAPTVQQVSILLRTRTVGDRTGGGLGGDTQPIPVTEFTDSTRPTMDEVQEVIDLVWPLIRQQVPELPADASGLVSLGAIYAAMMVEASFFREAVAGDSTLRDMYTAALENLRQEVEEPGQGVAGRSSFASLPIAGGSS